MPRVNIPYKGPVGGIPVTYNETVLNKEIDDLIYLFTNDPWNLFYWKKNHQAWRL